MLDITKEVSLKGTEAFKEYRDESLIRCSTKLNR